MNKILLTTLALLSSSLALAQDRGAGGGRGPGQGPQAAGPAGGIFLSASGMYMANASTQGGRGTSGFSVLTQYDVMYMGSVAGPVGYSYGVFLQNDKQGSAESDLMLGYKAELTAGPFFGEFGYAPYIKRAYTDRSIANQTGTVGTYYGGGMRTNLSFATWLYFQFAFKVRTQKIEKQDGVPLAEPIEQKDSYPLFGVGFKI